jgi:septum formation protein
MEPIILASSSPRRQEFFRQLGLPFTCMPSMIDETPQQGLSPRQATEVIALQKVMAIVEKLEIEKPKIELLNMEKPDTEPPHWVFGADTIVVLDGCLIGKAANRDAAGAMLAQLAGRTHEVITAMVLYNRREKRADCRSVSAEVSFAPLSAAEIEWYLDTGEWEGAAGSYQLQGMGACLVSSIHGSPSAVAGLPIFDFCVMLKDNGYPWIAAIQ